ncbi:zinc transporter ZIP1-like [Penaeus indicus]|uniref:zinc transporter ZIP1-like n=1 Tax=Penaeus indicus TaxID=29960 RepID=UPI00300CECFD
MLGTGGNKAAALVTMAVITIIAALVPLYVRKLLKGRMHLPRTQRALSGCLCFGAGVLMATVFLHLLPEARMFVNDAMHGGFLPHTPYPVAELIVCIGFIIIYIIEDVVHACVKRPSSGKKHKDLEMKRKKEQDKDVRHENAEEGSKSRKQEEVDESFQHLMEGHAEHRPEPAGHAHEHGLTQGISLLRAVIVVVAFSFHSVMEGLALGLQETSAGVWFLFAALMAHKVFIAFCLGMELLEVGVTLVPFVVSMVIFSLSSPVGGAMGALVLSLSTGETTAGVLVPTFLQGISAGTILYVTFCEVLERERAKPDGGPVRLVCFIIGFGFMSGLQVLDEAGNKLASSLAAPVTNSSVV